MANCVLILNGTRCAAIRTLRRLLPPLRRKTRSNDVRAFDRQDQSSTGAGRHPFFHRHRAAQAFFWVKPLAAMPRFAVLAATADMMSRSDCAEAFPIKR